MDPRAGRVVGRAPPRGISLRWWFIDQDGGGWPTKRGITLRPSELGEVIGSLRSLEEWLDKPQEVQRRGRFRPPAVEPGSIPVPGRSPEPFDLF
jgi:hypothetical protein